MLALIRDFTHESKRTNNKRAYKVLTISMKTAEHTLNFIDSYMLDGHIPERDTFYLGEITVHEH